MPLYLKYNYDPHYDYNTKKKNHDTQFSVMYLFQEKASRNYITAALVKLSLPELEYFYYLLFIVVNLILWELNR